MNKFLLLGYFLLSISFVFFSYLFIDPGLFYLKFLYSGFFLQNRLLVTVLYFIFLSLFFLLYFLTLRLIQSQKLKAKNIFVLIGVCVGILLFSYPAVLSFDIFNYIATAKVTFFYHENPYIVMPFEFLGDPLLLFTHASNKLALYGPLWIGLTSIPYYLGLNNFLLTLFNFKLFIVPFYLGSTFLIWKISKNVFSVAAFALNPLVLIETLVSSHNDIVMMFLALPAFFFLSNKKFFSWLWILGSILIKYATAALVPIFIYAIIQKKIKEKKIFQYCAFSMFLIFALSFLREEIYPWYAIWFLIFVCLLPQKKSLFLLSGALSFGLMLRYVPFMLYGTYYGTTPLLKIILTILPVVITLMYIKLRHKN